MDKQRKHRVLIVDDEVDVRECFRNCLEKRHHMEVSEAGDGETAVALARSFNPDIILLDIHMPKSDGWEVVRLVRQFNAAVKIIIITGWETVTEEQRSIINTDIAAYMRKPVVFDQVVAKMFEVLASNFKQGEFCGKVDRNIKLTEESRARHALVNIHSRVQMQCECFVANYEDGYYKDRSDLELLQESVKIMKDVAMAINEADVHLGSMGKREI